MADIKIKLKKSLIGCKKDQIATAASLGLRKIGDITVQPDKITEEIKELVCVLKVENTKSEYNYNLVVNMLYSKRYFFHSFLADKSFDINKYSEVKSPENKIPACTVPQTRAEPYYEEIKRWNSFSENRNIEKIVPEK